MKIAIVNIGQIISGDWRNPFVPGDTVLADGDRLTSVGAASIKGVENADVVIDAGGMTAIPGLDRFPRARYVWRLHTAATRSRLS